MRSLALAFALLSLAAPVAAQSGPSLLPKGASLEDTFEDEAEGHAQAPSPPSASDVCQLKCAERQMGCLMPCATKPGAAEPENQKDSAACMMKCAKAMEPCMNKCEQADKKKGKK